jgi:hypothetical protein
MLETHLPFSANRIKADIEEIEILGELVNQLQLPRDIKLHDIFQKLVELAGSREFFPAYSMINSFALNLKWSRQGQWDTGYIIPWTNIYPSLGVNTQLVSIATHLVSQPSETPKTPNTFGVGSRPVDVNRAEWSRILYTVLHTNFQKDSQTVHTYRVKRPMNSVNLAFQQQINQNQKHSPILDVTVKVETPVVVPEHEEIVVKVKKSPKVKKVGKIQKCYKGPKLPRGRPSAYAKSKMLSAMLEYEKLESQLEQAATAAGPNKSQNIVE